jgi:hypothetical protein
VRDSVASAYAARQWPRKNSAKERPGECVGQGAQRALFADPRHQIRQQPGAVLIVPYLQLAIEQLGRGEP